MKISWMTEGRVPAAIASLLLCACSGRIDSATHTVQPYSTSTQTVGDWTDLPTGQECLAALQIFYPARFGVHLPIAPATWNGSCSSEGACHLWLDAIPDPAVWQRIPNDGTSQPSTYDVIIYPPIGNDSAGHAAAVDHVEGGQIYVMDDNYVAYHVRSSAPHTVDWAPYGWYHLRSLPTATGGSGVGPSCGQLATIMSWGNAQCEWNGNGACGGVGPTTSDCAHCCDASASGGSGVGPSCGDLAQQYGWSDARCEWQGNHACFGSGPTTSDCAHCCDDPALGGIGVGPSCGELARQNGWSNARCEWNGNGACGGIGSTTADCAHCCPG